MYNKSGGSVSDQGLNKLIELCLRFCRANAYISSKTDEGENDVLVSLFECVPNDFVSSNAVTVGKILSSVCGKSLNENSY